MNPVRSTLVSILVATLLITMSWTKPLNVRAASSLATPIILTTSETVLAGETMDIQGGGFTLTSASWIQRINSDGTPDTSNRYQMVIANQSPYLIQAVVPSSMPAGLWSVTVVNPDGTTSNPKYVHQARGNGYDNQEVAAGDSLRIWGREMIAPGGNFHTAYATFTVGTTVLTALATAGDSYSMRVTVPSAVQVGTTYTVKVSNGLGGSVGENIIQYPLTIRPGGADPFLLGVPWGRDFAPFASTIYDLTSDSRLSLHAVGNGVANDLPAVQAASLYASQHGGGVLHFPAGTYLIDNASSSLYLYPKVVLEGAGQTLTTLQYAKNPSISQYFAVIDDAGEIGFKDMTIQDLNTGTTPVNALIDQYAAKSTEVFFKNITYHLGKTTAYGVGCYCNKALMSGSTVTSQASVGGAVGFAGSDIEFANNTVTFGGGRLTFNGDNMTIENNTIHRDGNLDYPQMHEDGGIELSFSRNVQVIGNDIKITGPIDATQYAFGSNEMIMSQSSVYNLGILGTATSATSTTLSDSSKDWSATDSFYPFHVNVDYLQHPIVAIIKGAGIGQWRNITPNGPHSMTVDHPWDIVPDASSGYVITYWTTDRFTVQGNTVANGKYALAFASGAHDSVVNGNTFTNTGFIGIQGDHDTAHQVPNQSNYLAWNNLVTNNTVTDTLGTGNVIGIFVGGTQVPYDSNLSGNIALDNEVRGNTVNAFATTPIVSSPINLNGYYNYIYEGGCCSLDSSPLGNMGGIFEKNAATNAPVQPYASLGSSQNTAHYPGEPVQKPCLNLNLADRPSNSESITGVQLKYFKTGTETLTARTENWPSTANGQTVLNDPYLTAQQAGQTPSHTSMADTGTYDVWIKAPGFLAKKITGVTHVQSQCIPMPSGLLAGDFTTDDQNTITLGDIVTFIRAFDGGTDSAANLVPQAFGGVLTINNLVTIIRRFIETPNGDAA